MATCLRLVSSKTPRSSAVNLSSLQKSNWLRRNVHRARELPYKVEDGLGKFLPPPALKTLVEYQEGLLERLNHELRADPRIEKHASVAQTAINYATKQERALAFNYSVLALNNSFFLDHLTPPSTDSSKPTHEDRISGALYNQIEQNYGDITRLKSTFSAAAMGMFSSGWVWLVTDSNGNLGILPTLGPSTLLVMSRRNMHYDPSHPVLGEDSARHAAANLPTPALPDVRGMYPTSPASGVAGHADAPTDFRFQSRSLHTSSAALNERFKVPMTNNIHSEVTTDTSSHSPLDKSDLMNVGKTLFPLFCVPVYEHAWMSAGYGVWGKEAWLRELWTVVDWEKISNAYNQHLNAKHL